MAVFTKERLKTINFTLKRLIVIIDDIDEIIIVVDRNRELHGYLEKKYRSYSGIKILDNNGEGLSKARNTAIMECKSEYIAFLDDDAIPSYSWINFIEKKKYINYEILGGPTIPLFVKGHNNRLPFSLYWIYGCTFPPIYDHNKIHEIENPIGANMIFKTNLLLKVNGFETNYGRNRKRLLSGDETQVCHKLRLLGVQIIFHPEMMVEHKVPVSRLKLKYWIKRAYYEGYSKGLMNNSDKTFKLKKEFNYVNYLAKKLLRSNIDKSIIIIIILISTGLGYVNGLMRR